MEESKIERAVNFYVKAWDTESIDDIKVILEKCWTAESTYMDPLNPLTLGIDGLAARIQASQLSMPGRRFGQLTKADVHHNTGRYRWLLTQQDGKLIEGMTFFEFNEANYITRTVGFFGVI